MEENVPKANNNDKKIIRRVFDNIKGKITNDCLSLGTINILLPVAPILVRQNLSPQQQTTQKKLTVLSIQFSHQ